jgi:uncharacterized protein
LWIAQRKSALGRIIHPQDLEYSLSTLTLQHLRNYAIQRSFFTPTTLHHALEILAFVQADPIRAPARAQDLTLRNRVLDYRAGDLEAQYPTLPIEEDFFVNYGFLSRTLQPLLHPRTADDWTKARQTLAASILAFVRERGVVHPSEVQAQFKPGKSKNWFGGTSNSSTQLLDAMHYRGMLRVAARRNGIRMYALSQMSARDPIDIAASMDALVDVIVAKYAPLPKKSLTKLISMLRSAVPQFADQRAAALARALQRLPSASVAGHTWFWPANENPLLYQNEDPALRLLAPFDPVVWDRVRFEIFWDWSYRFEAYTPAAKRVRGYYALPMVWQSQMLGWANLSAQANTFDAQLGYVSGKAPRARDFRMALDAELQRMQVFLGCVG